MTYEVIKLLTHKRLQPYRERYRFILFNFDLLKVLYVLWYTWCSFFVSVYPVKFSKPNCDFLYYSYLWHARIIDHIYVYTNVSRAIRHFTTTSNNFFHICIYTYSSLYTLTCITLYILNIYRTKLVCCWRILFSKNCLLQSWLISTENFLIYCAT